MGMFDTIYFEKPYLCLNCRATIDSVQVKEFECLLAHYRVKDCISHAEDIRIVKSELFCDKCREFAGRHIYIAVFRGILVGATDTLQTAQTMLNDMNLEKMLLWYHDLYKKYDGEVRENEGALRFLRNVVEWFEQGRHKNKRNTIKGIGDLPFLFDKEYLECAKDPLEAIKRFLAAKQKEKRALNS